MDQFETLPSNTSELSNISGSLPNPAPADRALDLAPAAIDRDELDPDELDPDELAPIDPADPFAAFDIADDSAAKTVVSRYFDLLNAEDFQATASLFAADGVLNPPFDSPLVGHEAIEHYLATEAKGLQLFPTQYRSKSLEDGTVEYQVGGKVQTPLFGVNVGWQFVLNAAAEILSVKVKLLASLEELLKLKS